MNGFRNLVVVASLVVLRLWRQRSGWKRQSGRNRKRGAGRRAAPSNATAAAESAPKADNAAAPATSDTLDRNYLVGRWSETGDCADATEFRADGTFVFPWGDTGTWQLDGDRLTLSTNTDAMRLTQISQDQVDAVSPGGSTHHHRRC